MGQNVMLTEEQKVKNAKALEEFKAHKRENRLRMMAMQKYPYEVKVARAKQRIREFIYECDKRGYNTHVTVGGGRQHNTSLLDKKHGL